MNLPRKLYRTTDGHTFHLEDQTQLYYSAFGSSHGHTYKALMNTGVFSETPLHYQNAKQVILGELAKKSPQALTTLAKPFLRHYSKEEFLWAAFDLAAYAQIKLIDGICIKK